MAWLLQVGGYHAPPIYVRYVSNSRIAVVVFQPDLGRGISQFCYELEVELHVTFVHGIAKQKPEATTQIIAVEAVKYSLM